MENASQAESVLERSGVHDGSASSTLPVIPAQSNLASQPLASGTPSLGTFFVPVSFIMFRISFLVGLGATEASVPLGNAEEDCATPMPPVKPPRPAQGTTSSSTSLSCLSLKSDLFD
jgi:hypothetical protein